MHYAIQYEQAELTEPGMENFLYRGYLELVERNEAPEYKETFLGVYFPADGGDLILRYHDSMSGRGSIEVIWMPKIPEAPARETLLICMDPEWLSDEGPLGDLSQRLRSEFGIPNVEGEPEPEPEPESESEPEPEPEPEPEARVEWVDSRIAKPYFAGHGAYPRLELDIPGARILARSWSPMGCVSPFELFPSDHFVRYAPSGRLSLGLRSDPERIIAQIRFSVSSNDPSYAPDRSMLKPLFYAAWVYEGMKRRQFSDAMAKARAQRVAKERSQEFEI